LNLHSGVHEFAQQMAPVQWHLFLCFFLPRFCSFEDFDSFFYFNNEIQTTNKSIYFKQYVFIIIITFISSIFWENGCSTVDACFCFGPFIS